LHIVETYIVEALHRITSDLNSGDNNGDVGVINISVATK